MNVVSPVESLLALAASVFEAHSAVLFEADERTQTATLAAWYSQSEAVANGARIAYGKGLVGWILRNKAPLLVNSIEENQAWLGYYQDEAQPEIHSFMGCPVPGGGALCIDSTRSQAFADSRQKLLHRFAQTVPQLRNLVSAYGHDREVAVYFSALERMASLREAYAGWTAYLSDVLKLLADVTGFSHVAFATRMEGSDTYLVEGEFPPLLNVQDRQAEFPISSGLVGWVFRNGEFVCHEGGNMASAAPVFGHMPPSSEFACALCVPVVVEKSICGVLSLAGTEQREISAELRSFARLVADDMARLLEVVALRYRAHKLMPRATLEHQGGVVFDPDAQSTGAEK